MSYIKETGDKITILINALLVFEHLVSNLNMILLLYKVLKN